MDAKICIMFKYSQFTMCLIYTMAVFFLVITLLQKDGNTNRERIKSYQRD